MKAFPSLHHAGQRFYLHHFITTTAAIYFPLCRETFLQLILGVSESSACMLGAVLVASCSHHARLKNDHESQVATIEATLQTLSSLQRSLERSEVGDGTLATTLMLATTCLCAGQTATCRQHVDGAIRIVEAQGTQPKTSDLWSFSIQWLAQLSLMDKLSKLPSSTLVRKEVHLDQLLARIPGIHMIEPATAPSFRLMILADEVWRLADARTSGLDNETFTARCVESLELQLLAECENTNMPIDNPIAAQWRQLHHLFAGACLLYLYRQVLELPSECSSVQATVSRMTAQAQCIDKLSHLNTSLLWPFLAAGCEARTEEQRHFYAERLTKMEDHGVGSCRRVREVMTKYWMAGASSRWDIFAQRIGADVILF